MTRVGFARVPARANTCGSVVGRVVRVMGTRFGSPARVRVEVLQNLPTRGYPRVPMGVFVAVLHQP